MRSNLPTFDEYKTSYICYQQILNLPRQSKYTKTKRPITSLSTSMTRFWKTAGALVRPKDQILKVTQRCVEQSLPLVPSLMWTRWFRRSSLVNTVAPWRGGKAELMSGKGYLFLTVMLFSPLMSLHGLNDPSFFFSKKNPASTREEEDKSCSQRVLDVPLHSLFCTGRERLNTRLLGRGAPGWRSMGQSYGR